MIFAPDSICVNDCSCNNALGERTQNNIYIQVFNDGRTAYIDELEERLQEYQKDMPKLSHDKDKGMEHDL